MRFFKELVSDGKQVSTVRVMSLFALLVAACIAMYGIYRGKDLSGVAEIVGVFVISAFGGKVTQKTLEK